MQRLALGTPSVVIASMTASSSSASLMRRPQSALHTSEVSNGATAAANAARCGPSSSCTTTTTTTTVAAATAEQRRGRFYRPIVSSGFHTFKTSFGALRDTQQHWRYQHNTYTPRPKPENPVNNYFGQKRIENPIPSRIGIVNKKATDWGYPARRPPPVGIRKSAEFFPFFFEKYFPSEECRLVVDSVLNTDSSTPVFHFPPSMSKREITNYLRNIYGLDNIVNVSTRNYKGRFFKNEIGKIKTLPDYKEAVVRLDSPVRVDFKQIKGTEDTPDNKKLT